MRRIHTKFSTFESVSESDPKLPLLGVFGVKDYKECTDLLDEITKSRGIFIPWFKINPFRGGSPEKLWVHILTEYGDGCLLVIYDFPDEMAKPNIGLPFRRPLIAGAVLANSGHVLKTTDNLFNGFEQSFGDKSVKKVLPYDNLWPVLSLYSKLRHPGDLSVSDAAFMMVGDGSDVTVDGLMSKVKKFMVEDRQMSPSLMSTLRRLHPEEYEKTFPDGGMSADMGDLGF